MAKGTVEKRQLTEDELADAERLKFAWEAFKASRPHGTTQQWLGKEAGLGNQSLVGQYLNGVIPLNPKAVLAFARVLGVHPAAISTRMEFPPPASGKLSDKELWIVDSYRASDAIGRVVIEDAVKTSVKLARGIGKDIANSAANDKK